MHLLSFLIKLNKLAVAGAMTTFANEGVGNQLLLQSLPLLELCQAHLGGASAFALTNSSFALLNDDRLAPSFFGSDGGVSSSSSSSGHSERR
mmetsp:Transcript_7839/g.16939  ORF Transcript_7839/g.16939 Transcript_7839/m.16939 type:complete len:92 (+) Transcript_7839:165-440(+)